MFDELLCFELSSEMPFIDALPSRRSIVIAKSQISNLKFQFITTEPPSTTAPDASAGT